MGNIDFRIALETPDSGAPILRIKGAADCSREELIRQEIMSLLESDYTNAIIDLEKVEFIDSTVLAVLIGGLKRFRQKEGDLLLVCPSSRIYRVFEVTGLDKIFHIFNCVNDAQEAIKENPAP